jgi:hypothetical protein
MRFAALAALLLLAAPAQAAERNYSVTSFDRIRIDGPYQVTLKTNVAPFAKATGSQGALDGVSVKVEGRTLIVRATPGGSWGGYPGASRGPATIAVGTHELKTVWINGAGALFVDKVKGLSFDASIQGNGVMRVDSTDVDLVKIGMSGAGSARLAGRAAKLTANVSGTSTLDAETLAAKDAVIGAEGPVQVRASVGNTAKVNALGLASVVVAGGAACEVKAQGSASVTGCD